MPPDLRYALRSLVRRPLFSLILISILAIGLGFNAAMFSVVDSVLLEPLPYTEADRLVWMWGLTPERDENSVSALDYMDYRAQSTTLEQLAAYSLWPERYVVTGEEEPEVLVAAATSCTCRNSATASASSTSTWSCCSSSANRRSSAARSPPPQPHARRQVASRASLARSFTRVRSGRVVGAGLRTAG